MMTMNDKSTATSEKKTVRGAAFYVKKAVGYIAMLFVVFLTVIACWLLVDKFIIKSPVPSFAGYSVLKVSTGSMRDTIYEGDFVLIKKTDDYAVDDIITFISANDGFITTHRIIGIDKDSGEYVTRGDANNAADRFGVKEDAIFGEVVLIMHTLGMIVGWMIDGGGIFYIVVIALIIILGVLLIKNENDKEKSAKESSNKEQLLEDGASCENEKRDS